MRAPSIFALSVALSLALASPGFIPPAHADPAYSPDTVIAVFVRDNAVAEAYKIRRTRVICLGSPGRLPKRAAARSRELRPFGQLPKQLGQAQLAWRFLRFQRDSALAQWYRGRTEDAAGKRKRTMIVALARKLLIALWRLVTIGEIPVGVALRSAVA